MKYMINTQLHIFECNFGYNCTRKWINCTLLHLVQLPIHFLMQLCTKYTQKHVITYIYVTISIKSARKLSIRVVLTIVMSAKISAIVFFYFLTSGHIHLNVSYILPSVFNLMFKWYFYLAFSKLEIALEERALPLHHHLHTRQQAELL